MVLEKHIEELRGKAQRESLLPIEQEILLFYSKTLKFRTIIDRQAEEIKRLKALCYRESGVLTEALKRKNNKSMIKVVADSLAEQALT